MGGSKAFLFLGFLLSLVLLIIASHVSARDLAQTSNADNKNVDATVNPNGVDEAKYGNGYGGYPGGGGGYNNGGRGGNNGGGGYNNGGYPGHGRGGGCYYGCCRRSNYGRGCARCCSYAGEAVVAETYRAQPHN